MNEPTLRNRVEGRVNIEKESDYKKLFEDSLEDDLTL